MSFHFDISQHIKVPLIFHIKFQQNIPSHFGEMDLNARVDVIFLGMKYFFKGRRKFLNVHCDLIPLQIFFYFDINQHLGPTNNPYKISAKYT